MVFVGLGAQTNLLDLDLGLSFFGLTFLFGLFVEKFTKIENTANRGI
jgi:hypothetical protein